MNQKEIKELIEFLIEKDIAEFELERGDVKLRVKRGQAAEGCPALLGDLFWSVICPEKLPFVILVVRNKPGQPAPPPHVAGERAVLGAGQLQPQGQPAPYQ